MNPLEVKNIYKKVRVSKEALEAYDIKKTFKGMSIPDVLGRDVELLPPKQHPNKKGLSHPLGQQRLLHDLASIELQAMELGVRSLIEFQGNLGVPEEFFNDLVKVTLEESVHCKLCLDLLEKIGGYWGMFPVHIGLWNVAKSTDDILDRLLKVHRYLEGSGLDATFTLANRLKDIKGATLVHDLIVRIATDEISHVQFGSKWFAYFCDKKQVSRVSECKRILKASINELPYRREPIKENLRLDAGFLSDEIKAFQEFQKELCI